ncbi:MAG: iron donor protein CyaY [Myxococcaceae bacterium]|nr:iron donor protein CyaY [Myxococcaceae bacterium]
MEETTYNALIATAFKRIVKGLDDVDPDLLDVVSTGDKIDATHLPSGEKVVVNTQRAIWQIWVAGRGQGIHFSHQADGRWLDDKGKGLELFAWVTECVTALTGEPLTL